MSDTTAERQRRLLRALDGRRPAEAYLDPAVRRDMEAEANDPGVPEPAKLVRRDMLEMIREHVATGRAGVAAAPMPLFFSNALVVVVPGFLGSKLSDLKGGSGLIWINPNVVFRDRLRLLQLAPFAAGKPERDLDPAVDVEPTGVLPLIYDLISLDLEPRRYSVGYFPVDWRKDLEVAAGRLRDHLAGLLKDSPDKPVHVVAHSQGAMVARRGLQLLAQAQGEAAVKDRIKSLVLLGPANQGSFSAAFALAGNHDSLKQISPYVVDPPGGFQPLIASMSGVYQLLPWNAERLKTLSDAKHAVGSAAFWEHRQPIEPTRLAKFHGWAKAIDSSFLNDRTTIILGDNYGRPTIAGVAFDGSELKVSHTSGGDGTVPDACAWLDGVKVYRASGTEHSRLATYPKVIEAVRQVLKKAAPDGLEVVTKADALKAEVDAARAPALAVAGEPVSRLLPFEAVGPASLVALKRPWLFPTAPPKPALPKASKAAGNGHAVAAPAPALADPAEMRSKTAARKPPYRRLRVFAFDPLLSRTLETQAINQITLQVPWEDPLLPGPVGEYVEVVDVDPSTPAYWRPVDLNASELLAVDGLAPSESDPRFHQQMAYAVAMTVIGTFEQALGRKAIWAPRIVRDAKGKAISSEYVQRLRIHPHALREQNAYYSPDKKALLFGYFQADASPDAMTPPGGTVFACLSHDVVAHETTHALLDGFNRYFNEPSNPDVLAFHEAFADIVALFQHFSHADVLRSQVARTRGDLSGKENLLGQLAVEFGRAVGHGALRDAIGRMVKDEASGKFVWQPAVPDTGDYERSEEPHARGSVLVAAVFDGFLTIYRRRIAKILSVATDGTGVLRDGALHPDLVDLIAAEAAKAARHVLMMCLRAIDYCPPVDLTFGEYLRAMITADADLVPDDDLNYRLAMVRAFAARGIYPPGVRNLSVDSLLWRRPTGSFRLAGQAFDAVKRLRCVSADPTDDRGEIFARSRVDAAAFHRLLAGGVLQGLDRFLGLRLDADAPASFPRRADDPQDDPETDGTVKIKVRRPLVEVHSVRVAHRVGPDGQRQSDLIVEITQRRSAWYDPAEQTKWDAPDSAGKTPPTADFDFRGGCTLIFDLTCGEVRYAIVKDVMQDSRLERERNFRGGAAGTQALMMTYLDSRRGAPEPFAILHRAF